MADTLPPPDMRGPSGTGSYFDGYTVATVQKIVAQAVAEAVAERDALRSLLREAQTAVCVAGEVLDTRDLPGRIAEALCRIRGEEKKDE